MILKNNDFFFFLDSTSEISDHMYLIIRSIQSTIYIEVISSPRKWNDLFCFNYFLIILDGNLLFIIKLYQFQLRM